MTQFFETRKGRVSLGLALLSGGGMLITQAMQKITDPQILSILQFVLVFWVILTARLTYAFGWKQQQGTEQGQAVAGVPLAVKAAAKKAPAGKAAAAKQDSGSDEDEGSDGAAGKPRRRRTRRD